VLGSASAGASQSPANGTCRLLREPCGRRASGSAQLSLRQFGLCAEIPRAPPACAGPVPRSGLAEDVERHVRHCARAVRRTRGQAEGLDSPGALVDRATVAIGRRALEFLQPVVVVLFLVYPAILEIGHDGFGNSSPLWIVVEILLPVVVGLTIGRYWATALAVSEIVWFFIDLARGRTYAVRDWHEHTGYEVAALVLYALLVALLIALGVWIRRRFFRQQGAVDRAETRRANIRAWPVFSSPVTTRELLPFIACAAILFIASFFTSGATSLLTLGAAAAAYFGGWFYLHRRATRPS